MKNVIIIDALNMFLRSYVISPHLDKKGWPVGGTIGFLKSLQKVARDFAADEIIIAWDGHEGSARRRSMNKDYKGGRKPVRFNRRMVDLPEDKEEANKIITMSRSEFLQHLKDRQQENIEYTKKSKEEEDKNNKKRVDPDYQLYFKNSQKLAHIEDEEIISEFFDGKSSLRNKENIDTNLLMLQTLRENFSLLTELDENELPSEDLL